MTSTSCTDYSGKPDLYIKVKELNDNAIYQSAAVSNTNPPVTFTLPNVQISHNQSYLIEVWDEDTGVEAPDDNCATFQVMGNTNNINLTSGNNGISIVVEKPVFIYNDTVTITVFEAPSKPDINAYPSDSVCMGDSVLLSTASTASLQWYNDTTLLMGATQQQMWVLLSGRYVVVATNDSTGCQAKSDTLVVSIFNNPPKPTFWRQGDSLRTLLAGLNLQWYHNAAPITGATGQVCHIFAAGFYKLIATTNEGCFKSSDSVYYQPFNNGINTTDYLTDFKLYPNPNNGHFQLEYTLIKNETLSVAVYNVLGQQIYTEQSAYTQGNHNYVLHLSLPAAVYIVELKNDNGQCVAWERLVVE